MRTLLSVFLVASVAAGVRAETRAAARADGAFPLTMPPGSASDQNPAFSPDGSRLVFTRFGNGYNEGPAALFVLDLASGQERRITPVEDQDNVNLPGAAWNGDRDRVVFASDRAEADDLWQVAPDGSDLRRLSEHSGASWFLEPSWSPDGSWIVFERSFPAAAEDGRMGEIWKVKADGSGLTALTGHPDWDDRQPNWSPAGDRIVLQRRPRGGDRWSLFTVRSDGSDLRPLRDDTLADDSDAAWSPTGSWVVFSSNLSGGDAPVIAVVPLAGGLAQAVTCSGSAWDSAPSWSPDGTWIAFESHSFDEAPASLWGQRLAANPCSAWPVLPRVRRGGGRLRPGTATGAVDDFLYQLQNLDLAAVGATAFDLVIMDYSADGDDASAYSGSEIDALRHSPGGQKVVLSYMSIGEAEDYRFYWQQGFTPGSPAWLDEENPDWPGNYKVRFWDPAWQAIVMTYVDRLLAAGFDGVYLDIIDAYEYYEQRGRTSAAAEMADLVARIAGRARAADPDFLVFPQNAPELAQRVPAYLELVDGIGQESVYYGWDQPGVATPAGVTEQLEEALAIFTAAGKLVLTTDYTRDPAQIDAAYDRSCARGFVPYVTVVDLDELIINAGHEPD